MGDTPNVHVTAFDKDGNAMVCGTPGCNNPMEGCLMYSNGMVERWCQECAPMKQMECEMVTIPLDHITTTPGKTPYSMLEDSWTIDLRDP